MVASYHTSRYVHVSKSLLTCVYVTNGGRKHTTFPRENMEYSLLFLLLLQIKVCFINAMVICFSLLWTMLPEMEDSPKETH